ncbi:PREDICTED: callose synthase 2-like [Ipomoea nil]|uniref:callose synthase 2-like n=1 Tax=Ipomoea nil TaxID=35883 RepID=UPI0009015FFF|nr:PREDICTED: callose synthase 2-like [Ipomoea nil]
MLSCYFTTVGFYFSTMITVLVVYVFLYGRLYLVLSGLENGLISHPAIRDNKPLQVALASQSFVQIGLLMALPMMMEIGLERGFRTALTDFVKGIELMILALVYHIFGKPYRDVAYILVTMSIWFLVGTWLFAPFLFNPSGFEWQKILDDWTDWNKWIHNQGGIGVPPAKEAL